VHAEALRPSLTSVLLSVLLRTFVDTRTFPDWSATSCRSSCDDMGTHRRRQQHERDDAAGAYDKREFGISYRDTGKQAAEAQGRGLRRCLHPSEDVRHPQHPDSGEERER